MDKDNIEETERPHWDSSFADADSGPAQLSPLSAEVKIPPVPAETNIFDLLVRLKAALSLEPKTQAAVIDKILVDAPFDYEIADQIGPIMKARAQSLFLPFLKWCCQGSCDIGPELWESFQPVDVPFMPINKSDDPNSKPEKLRQLPFAKSLIACYGGPAALLFFDGQFWAFDSHTGWELLADAVIQERMYALAEDLGQEYAITSAFVSAVLSMVKNKCRFVLPKRSGGVAIAVQNGELHFDNGSFGLHPHKLESYSLSKLPVTYDVAAKAPRFAQFLDEIFAIDPDRIEKRKALLQMMGLSLTDIVRFEKYVMLIGSGANGKSVLLDILVALVGAENVCAIEPNQFEDRFKVAAFQHKLINIVFELAIGTQVRDAAVKRIVSGELITAERKYMEPFTFAPYCKLWFGTNHLPNTRDHSAAWFRRAIILQFNRTFEENERDPNLSKKLREELPGILNLALAALAEVLVTNKIPEPPSSTDAKNEWRVDVDQVAQFVDERCAKDPDARETSCKLYEAYKLWAAANGISMTFKQRVFTQKLVENGATPDRNATTRFLRGIRLRDGRE